MHLTSEELARRVGVARRAVVRWESGEGFPEHVHLVGLARVFHEHDPARAEALAASRGVPVAALGVVPGPAPAASVPSPAALKDALDAAVCAAAETLDVSPRGLRPVLAAVFARMRDSGLTVEQAAAMTDASSR